MARTKKRSTGNQLAKRLELSLLEQFGPVLTGDSLRQALGYPSMNALRQAAMRGNIPVPLFKLENRRGRFALAIDVARWLADQCDPESHDELQKDLETN